MGIVKVPVVTVFATDEPDIIPVIPDPKIAALADSSHFSTMAKAKSKNIFHHLLFLKEHQTKQTEI